MKRTKAISILLILMTTWSAPIAAADGPPSLVHNPFSRPSSDSIRPKRNMIKSDDDSTRTVPLQATMVGQSSRLANVDGRILKPGDEYEGHRLLAIYERYAVFERDGRKITVYVRPEQPEETDDRR